MYDFGVNTLGQQWIWGQVNQVETVRARQTKIMALGTAHGTSYTVSPPTRAEAFNESVVSYIRLESKEWPWVR